MAFNSNNAIFFSIFIQALHYMQKKSDFGGPFCERFVHLYLTFVTMHKTYSEFLCKNSFALSTTLFHTFLRNCRKIFQLCSFAQKIHRFLPMMSFMLSTTLFHTFSRKYKLFFKKSSERVKLSIIPLLYGHGRPRNATLSENNPLREIVFVQFNFKEILLYYTVTGEAKIKG